MGFKMRSAACATVLYSFLPLLAHAQVSFNTETYGNLLGAKGIVTGDFNGDGILDLVSVNPSGNSMSYLRGNGDGTFQAPLTANLPAVSGTVPLHIVAADFNQDGKLDVAIAYDMPSSLNAVPSEVVVLLGNGAGGFNAATPLLTAAPASGIASGDFNGDGIPDLAVAECAGGNTLFYLGAGNGSFTLSGNAGPVSCFLGGETVSLVAADMNNDGITDLVVSGGQTSVVLGSRSGSFPTISWPSAYNIAVADFDKDGNLDIASSNGNTQPGGGITIFFGNGTGAPSGLEWTGPGGDGPGVMATADFDSNGFPDLVIGNQSGTLGFWLNHSISQNTGQTVSVNESEEATDIIVGDFNGDGRPDIALTNGSTGSSGGSIIVLLNTSPRGCTDTLNLTYTGSIDSVNLPTNPNQLNMTFTLQTVQPATWSAWMAYESNVVNLWSIAIPTVGAPGTTFDLPVNGFPSIGNIGILTTLTTAQYGLVCADWQVVNTGGSGPTPTALLSLIFEAALAPYLGH